MADAHTSLRHRSSCVSTQSSNSNLGNGDVVDANKENQQGAIGKTFEGDARKSLFDILTLSVMALQIILFFLPTSTSRWLGLGLFKKEGSELSEFFKRELSVKMGDDYHFESAPVEFNTWLLFRELVDLILLNDFTSYIYALL